MKWLYKAQREFPAHIVFVLKDAYTVGMEKILGWGDKEFLYVLKGELFISYRTKENDEEMYAFFKNKVKDKKFLQDLKTKTEQAKQGYEKETKGIRERCKKECSWKELSQLYERAYAAEYSLLSIMNFTFYFEQAGSVPGEAKATFEEIAEIRNSIAKVLYAFYHDDFGGLFKKMQEKINLPKKLIGFMFPDEIRESLRKQKATMNKKELEERRRLSILLVEKKKARYIVGKEAEKMYEELQKSETKQQSEIKGQTAYPGKVQGTVCKVETYAELKKIKQGDILVTPMTSVTYVPYLEKVAGIVTDEGGIICHAASIAREMKIPTVIGTKIATKILKDGDLVEVDAEKGIVR
ncbi:MAG: PEP-utilizing enzyme, partial [Nanoarchaeota archaeon]